MIEGKVNFSREIEGKLLLTRNDVAKVLSISPASVSRRISDGILPGVIRIGGNVRISKKALTDYIDKLIA
jgi:predicted DNA-binding transcriptional regulator AlpA